MSAFPISLVDLSAVMIYDPGGEDKKFPLFRAEMDRLREQLHDLGHEITWLAIAGTYAVTPSNLWAKKENNP